MNTFGKVCRYCLLPTACCQLFLGCAPEKQPPPAPKPQPVVAVDMQAWMHGMRDDVAALAEISHQLPGQTDAEHRKLMADAFASLSKILPMLHGAAQTGQFTLQMQTLADARAQLARGSASLPIDPTIDLALRASAGALADIQQGNPNLTDRAEISQALVELQQWIGQLDVVHGALHRQVEGNAVAAIAKATQAMDAALEEKMNGPTTATSN